MAKGLVLLKADDGAVHGPHENFTFVGWVKEWLETEVREIGADVQIVQVGEAYMLIFSDVRVMLGAFVYDCLLYTTFGLIDAEGVPIPREWASHTVLKPSMVPWIGAVAFEGQLHSLQ